MDDPYLTRMLDDLAKAESALRAAITNRNLYSTSDAGVEVCQTNVDRMHELVRSYLSLTEAGDAS